MRLLTETYFIVFMVIDYLIVVKYMIIATTHPKNFELWLKQTQIATTHPENIELWLNRKFKTSQTV